MFLSNRPFNKRIQVLLVLIGTGLLCAFALVQRQLRHEREFLASQLSQQHQAVEQWLGNAQWVLRRLRDKALLDNPEFPDSFEQNLETTPRMLASGLGFSWDHRQGKSDMGNLIGSGPLEGRDAHFMAALRHAQHLAPLLAGAAKQLPEGSRLRFESHSGLGLYFPWEPSSRFLLPQPLTDKMGTVGTMTRPAQWGEPFYTDPQIGLLVPVFVDVFANGVSVGRLQIDLTLASLQRQMAPYVPRLGQFFLVDERGAVLNYPGVDLLQSERAPRLNSWLEVPWVASARELHALASGPPRWFGDRWVLGKGLTGAPWSLVLEVRRGELLACAIQAQAANLLGLFAFLLLAATVALYWQYPPQPHARVPRRFAGPPGLEGKGGPLGQAATHPAPTAPAPASPTQGACLTTPNANSSTPTPPGVRSEGSQALMATAVQRAILPRRWPEVSGWEMAATMNPACTGGKDFYDWMRHPDGSVAVVLASVRGTGLAAALYAVRLRTAWRIACHAAPHDPALAMRLWQSSLRETVGDNCLPVRALHGVIDTESGRVQCISVAHAPPWHVPHQGVPATLFQPADWLPDFLANDPANWPLMTFSLLPGEVLVMVTDHSRDVTNYRGETLGADTMVDLLASGREVKAQSLAESVVREVIRFVEHPLGPEDIGCVVIRRRA